MQFNQSQKEIMPFPELREYFECIKSDRASERYEEAEFEDFTLDLTNQTIAFATKKDVQEKAPRFKELLELAYIAVRLGIDEDIILCPFVSVLIKKDGYKAQLLSEKFLNYAIKNVKRETLIDLIKRRCEESDEKYIYQLRLDWEGTEWGENIVFRKRLVVDIIDPYLYPRKKEDK